MLVTRDLMIRYSRSRDSLTASHRRRCDTARTDTIFVSARALEDILDDEHCYWDRIMGHGVLDRSERKGTSARRNYHDRREDDVNFASVITLEFHGLHIKIVNCFP